MRTPVRRIRSVAPIRINDLGGWTDTWFAEYGTVLNIGVYPYVQCEVQVHQHTAEEHERIIIVAENYGDRYALNPEHIVYDKHPLLEAAFEEIGIPRNIQIEVIIYSSAPQGCSTGTSAAVSVALIGALDALTPGRLTPNEVAATAHRIETERLGLQSGIQDQLSSAFGGICFIEMHQYPHAAVSKLDIPNALWWELESRMSLIFLGQSHESSEVHKQVIVRLEGEGKHSPDIERLRQLAVAGKNALYEGNIDSYGKAMIENTDAQKSLHPELVGERAQRVIDIARRHGASGWKVNGAGGDGGSVTVLGPPNGTAHRMMLKEIDELGDGIQHIPTYFSRYGLRVWEGQ
ncbi:GHMP kinase [candidate division KSB3 bacterium]|uniref:GHMP kinase n=1 Tax=candidate division KSB3 bacterium TaxID=2044937 RepID=A0A9D5JWL6_9BACT|nr:GHMP kinase [candidate division KSB3 bacterium]MBD3325061.1 GHMP kinase [candidate division KSB3 bacterium]